MKTPDRIKILDITTLKIIAMVSMVLDHVGDNFFPGQTWMRIAGRMAMPIFAFCICEGYLHTRDKRKYLLRMILFGIVSEIPFDLVTSGKPLEFTHQNIILTFAWAIVCLICCEGMLSRFGKKIGYFLSAASMLGFMILSVVFGLDYNFAALAVIFTYYLLKDRDMLIRNTAAMIVHLLLRNVGIYLYGILGFIPLFMYNGKRGRGYKWLFYVFYPGHLMLIYLIREVLK